MRSDYIVHQKKMIKLEVDRVVAMINHAKAQSETITKEKIKSRAYEAYDIAQHIYQQNKTSKSKVEIKQMILDALRPIRFADGSGYYFATRLDGIEILFANKPEMEGLNLLDMQDMHGYVQREKEQKLHDARCTFPFSGGRHSWPQTIRQIYNCQNASQRDTIRLS